MNIVTFVFGRCIQRGAELLDRERPRWADEVDTDSLDMGSNNHCVFGQCYNSFDKGCRAFDMGHLKSTWFGFDSIFLFLYRQTLTNLWIPVIEKRKVAASA